MPATLVLQPGFSQFFVLISKMCTLGVHVVRTCVVCCDAILHDVIMDVETGHGEVVRAGLLGLVRW